MGVMGPPKAPRESISSKSWFDSLTGKWLGAGAPLVLKNTLYAPSSEEVNVNEASSPPAIVTGPEGTGERTVTAPGEKNRTTLLPSVVENATVSPSTTGTELELGTNTPASFVIVISVCAIRVTLIHFFAVVQ
jgi:hypothetical protein